MSEKKLEKSNDKVKPPEEKTISINTQSKELIHEAIDSLDWMLSNILGVVIVKQDEVDKFLEIIERYTNLEVRLENELAINLKVEINRFVAQLTPALKAFLEVKSASYADKKVQRRIKKLMRTATASLEQAIELIELENAITLGLGEYVEYAKLEEKLAAPLRAKNFEQVRQIWDEFFATQSKEWKKRVAKELEGITERFNNNAKDRVRAIYIDTVKAIEEKLKLGELSGQTVAQSAQAILDDVTRDPSTDKLIPKIYKSALNRAEAIAYTEIHRARVATILEIAEADGKKYFTWVTMGDGRVCDRCRALHGKTRLRTRWTEVPPLHPRGRCVLIPGRGAKSVQGIYSCKAHYPYCGKIRGEVAG
jgi:SPP1 gp7 family putative phage head morphogenesis protein